MKSYIQMSLVIIAATTCTAIYRIIMSKIKKPKDIKLPMAA